MCQSTTKTIFSVHENLKKKKVIIITIIMCFYIYIYILFLFNFFALFHLEDVIAQHASHFYDGPQSNRPQLRQALPSPWQLLPRDIFLGCSGW